jgi:PAS domain S-box-containing protein
LTSERSKEELQTKARQTESPFWAAFMISLDVILIHEPDGRILEANPTAQEKLGYTAEELEGMNILDLVLVSDAEMKERVDLVGEHGELSFRARHKRKDGTIFESEVRTSQVEVGGRKLIVGVGRDITDLRLAEMMNSTLDRMSSLLSSRLDFDDIMRSTVRTARTALGSDSASIVLKEGDSWTIRYEDGRTDHQRTGSFTTNESTAARIVEETGRVLLINDVQVDPRMNQGFAARYGIQSLLMAPLRMNERTIGLLGFFCHRQKGVFTDTHVDFANRLAYSITLLLENARLSESGRATEDFLRGVVDTVPDAIVVFDRNGRFTFANKAAERLLDLSRESILERQYDDPRWGLRSMDNEPLPSEKTPFGLVMSGQQVIHDLEFKVERGARGNAVISINITPLFGPKGEFTGAIASMTDISERKRSEDILRRRTHQLEVLTGVSDNLNSHLQTDTISRSLVQAALELTEGTAGTSGQYVDGHMVFTEYNDGSRLFPIDLSFPKGYGVPGWIISTKKAYMTNNAAEDVHVIPVIRERFRIVNLINVPILGPSGELLGCFEIHNKARGAKFTAADVTILEGLASSAAVALENARILEEKSRYEAALEKQKRDYQTVFESVPALIAIKDTQDRVIMANHTFREKFGLTGKDGELWAISPEPEVRGRHYLDDREVIDRKMAKLGILEKATGGNGETLWLMTDKMPYLDGAGHVLGVIMFSLDITEQKRAQDQLVREKEQMSTLMETTPSGIVLIDRKGRIVFVNRAAETILGTGREKVLGQTFDGPEWHMTDFEGNPFPTEKLPFSVVTATGRPAFGIQHAIQLPERGKIMLQLNAAPIFDHAGTMNGVIVSMEDVTAAMQTEKALRTSLKTSADIIQQIPSGILIFQYEAPDRLKLLSVNPTANILLGGMENKLGWDFDRIWKKGAFFATKEEFLDVVRSGRTIWREGVYYSDISVNGNFTFRAFCLPDDRLCVNFDDVTERIREAQLRRQAFAQIEKNIEHFATLVDRIRNPLSAIIVQAGSPGDDNTERLLQRAGEIEGILGQLDQGWLESEKVRDFLKKSL